MVFTERIGQTIINPAQTLQVSCRLTAFAQVLFKSANGEFLVGMYTVAAAVFIDTYILTRINLACVQKPDLK